MRVFRLAWRNVWRNRRRTIVTVSAMTLALLVLILYAGLMEGMVRDMESDILDLEVGDVQIHADDYRENPSLYTRIEDPEALLEPLDEAGFAASARLLGFGLAAAEESSAGASFRGIDVERDARVSQVNREVAEGRWLDPGDPRGVVLGRRLARTLAVVPGAELLVLSQGADGSLAYDLFTVRGVLNVIGEATDRTGVFMTEEAFRELMVVPGGVHQIIVRRPPGLDLQAAALRVRSVAAEYDVQTWRQLMPTIASMLDSVRGVIYVMFVIFYVAVGILVLNAMLMAVFERVREFGVLKALGVGPFEVLRIVLAEAVIQVGLAVAVGVALAIPALLYLERVGVNLGDLAGISMMGVALNPVWRAYVTASVFAGPIVVLLVIALLAVLYPALKAAWIRPVEAMHHQ